LQIDKVNSQVASDLVSTLVDWEAFDEDRQQLMLAQLQRLDALGDQLSEDVRQLLEQALPDDSSSED
jgi:aminopeptidase N